jgi:hypothetical protein
MFLFFKPGKSGNSSGRFSIIRRSKIREDPPVPVLDSTKPPILDELTELLSKNPEVSSGEMNRLSISYEYVLYNFY